MAQGPSDTILVAIRITLRIRESKVQNPDPPYYSLIVSCRVRRRFVLSERILVLYTLHSRISIAVDGRKVSCFFVAYCTNTFFTCGMQIQNQMANLNISPAGYPVNAGMAAAADPYRLNWGNPQSTQPYQMSANVNQ